MVQWLALPLPGVWGGCLVWERRSCMLCGMKLTTPQKERCEANDTGWVLRDHAAQMSRVSGVGWGGLAGEHQCAESQPRTEFQCQHHKAKHRKVSLQLHDWPRALFPEDGLMRGHFPDRRKELQKVAGLSYSPCTRVLLESPHLLSQFFTFDRS